MELNISFFIQLMTYTILFGGCLKYLSATLVPNSKYKDENYKKRQFQEISELKREIDYINERFAVNYDSARRGNLKKRNSL